MDGNYEGKTCPYCKTPFRDTDEVVVCSDCEMPHHRECFIENRGCTTFGCQGTITGGASASYTPGAQGAYTSGYAQVPAYAASITPQAATPAAPQGGQPQGSVRCSSCGRDNSGIAVFCSRCGTRLKYSPTPPAPANAPQGGSYSAAAQPIPLVCPRCGTQNSSVYSSCRVCGTSLRQAPVYQGYGAQQYGGSQYQPNAYAYPQGANYGGGQYQNAGNYQTGAGNVSDDEETEFIRNNVEFYREKFDKMRAKSSNASWNWAAFFFNVYWCFYRKLYGYGLIIMAVSFFLSLLIYSTGFGILLSFGVEITVGIISNSVYMRQMELRLSESRTMYGDERQRYLKKKGGTSGGMAVLAYFIMVAINVAAVLIMGVPYQ